MFLSKNTFRLLLNNIYRNHALVIILLVIKRLRQWAQYRSNKLTRRNYPGIP